MGAHLAWQDPTDLEPWTRLHKNLVSPENASYWDEGGGDFGYLISAQPGKRALGILVTFYDGAPWPDVWAMTLY